MSFRTQMRYMNPYDIHKAIVNDYLLRRPGDTKLLQRDKSKDRTVNDVIRENHKFIWNEDTPKTWEAQFAKKYYDKLFKEYCIADLSRYKENRIAMRWRTEPEVVTGKGQFICGNKKCTEQEVLRSWEVNFAYKEENETKHALVKIRLCPSCSKKLNYHSKKREVKRIKKSKIKKRSSLQNEGNSSKSADNPVENEVTTDDMESTSDCSEIVNRDLNSSGNLNNSDCPWDNVKPVESKSREDEMEEYLQDLLL